MGHVVKLLVTDPRYLEKTGISDRTVRAVIPLDGSNWNELAEITGNPGPVAENIPRVLGIDPARPQAMSPIHNA